MSDDTRRSTSNSHEPGSLRDGTAGLEANGGATPQDAIDGGHKDAKANSKKEQKESTFTDTDSRDEIVKDAHELARLNHEAEQEIQNEGGTADLKNDTSRKAKIATAKSQLDPAGHDPISQAEVAKSATDASMETGNKTDVDNRDAAERSKNPGRAEEESPRSLAGDGAKPPQNATTEKVSDESTSNRKEAQKAEQNKREGESSRDQGNSN